MHALTILMIFEDKQMTQYNQPSMSYLLRLHLGIYFSRIEQVAAALALF